MDIRKPFLQSFTMKELMQFIDHYIERREMLHLPGHSWEVCDLAARFLGFGYSRQWTADETSVLVKNFSRLGAEKTSELLLMRTAYDCTLKADKMGLHTNIRPSRKKRHTRWSIFELDILSKYYPIIGTKTMILLPGRTDAACVCMAQKTGIAAPGTGPWSEREIEVLRNHYPQMGTDAALLLPGRSSGSTGDMARKLGISGPEWEWTTADDEIIKAEYPHMGPSVATLLNGRRTEAACAQRAQFLGISCPIEELMWSKEEIEVLKKNVLIDIRQPISRCGSWLFH